MAVTLPYKQPRGTRSAFNALATASGLTTGLIYLITDESRLSVALSSSVASDVATKNEIMPISGGTFTGKFTTFTSVAGSASMNIPHGVAPTTPIDGDVWTTTDGMYARINGATVGPFGTGGGGGGGNPTVTSTVPSSPSDNSVALYSRESARDMLGYKSSDGDSVTLQSHIGKNRVSNWVANGNTTVASMFGLVDGTNLGTPAASTVAFTTFATRIRRISFPTTSASATLGGKWFANQLMWSTGVNSSTPAGGFHFMITFIPAFTAGAASARYFLGLSTSTVAPTNVEPTTVLGQIGIGKISTSNNLHIIFAGSSAQTPIDLGANFSAITNRTNAYRATFYASAYENQTVRYHVERLDDGTEVSGTITGSGGSQVPLNSQMMQPRWWITNNLQSALIGLDVASMYIETDN